MNKTQDKFMQRAILLAKKGLGKTSPNPIVGAVLVKNNKIIGEGYHKKAGSLHAEINAINSANESVAGADLYVTLEPCNHFGKTPPCCKTIIDSKIKKVFVGTVDPNPKVNGKGLDFLKSNGIKIVTGVCEEECKNLISYYQKRLKEKSPFVILKAAISLDGKIATENKISKWITNDRCRNFIHKIRNQVDAIVVGLGTVYTDDPMLTVRVKGKKIIEKTVIVLDEKLLIPEDSNLFKRDKSKLIIATTMFASKEKRNEFIEKGYDVLVCQHNENGCVFIPDLMAKLVNKGICSIMVEGGGKVYSDFIKNQCIDRIIACIAPKIIGGKGLNLIPNLSFEDLDNCPKFDNIKIKKFSDNVVIEGDFQKTSKI